MKSKLLFLICTLVPSVLFAQDNDRSYKIFETKTGQTVRLEQLIKNVKSADVIVFGEEHNDSTGHVLEAKIFAQLIKAYPGTALSLEMFATDVQPVINEYLAGLISEKNFQKEARVWNNYADYKPLIDLAKENKAQVIGANVATRYSNAVSMGGLQKLNDFPEASKAFLPPLPIDTATGRYHEKFIETLGGHDMGSMKIYQTQNLWDASMGWAIAKHAKANPETKILQINGRFHSDEQIGTIGQLKKYAPNLSVTNISCFAAEDLDQPDWKKYSNLGDYIILTRPAEKKK